MSTAKIEIERWTCDRCGVTADQSEEETTPHPRGWVEITRNRFGERSDLCPECAAALRAFMSGAPVQGTAEHATKTTTSASARD
jgi:hypothetical protein